MPGKTYKIRAIVLRKTKLGEKDLIVTLLSDEGSLVKAVAKGARRPGGSLAARVELFTVVKALVAQGRTLGVLSDVRIEKDGVPRQLDLEQSACAAPIAELVGILAQEGLPQPRLFEMTRSALVHLKSLPPDASLALCAAFLWKAMAQVGYLPRLDSCARCGNPVEGRETGCFFSYIDGGTLCESCGRGGDASWMPPEIIGWCSYLLRSRFDDLAKSGPGSRISFESLQIARQWIRVHCGRDVKSLDFLFTSGLF